MSNLTEEQKKRIEENRRKALEKRAAAKARQQTGPCVNIPIQRYPVFSVPCQPSNALSKQTQVAKPLSVNFQTSLLMQPNANQTCSSDTTNLKPSSVVNTYTTGALVPTAPNIKPMVAQSSNSVPPNLSADSLAFQPKNFSSVSTGNLVPKKEMSTSYASSSGINNKDKFSSVTTQIKGTFIVLNRKRFFVNISYHQQMIEIFKTIPSRMYDAKTKRWNFAYEDHEKLVQKLLPLKPNVVFAPLPLRIIKLFLNAPVTRQICEHDLSSLDPVLLNSLLPFQKEGVNFGIQLGGKVLIADDMGLGKTIQAIAIANYFKDDWPLLVVTPSSVRYSWAEAFSRWLPSLGNDLTVINSGKDHIPNNKVILLSYDLLTKKKDEILKRGFKSVIIDESHFLKNHKSARTKAAQQVMQQMRRIIMLSGTPALSRPIELFPQISALNSKEFSNFLEFGLRYCNGKKAAWGWDFSGSSHMEELRLILEETVMIRRLKCDVIKQLPSKIRQVILLDTTHIASRNKMLIQMSKKMATSNLKGMERRGVLLQYFHETGITKLPYICEYIRDLLEADRKFLCFAHHQIVLDGVSKELEDYKVKYIRIDGSTPSEQRKVLCDKFQLSDNCKVAVLSITAANAGISLTSAHLVVFAELFWNPGILTQAEDRVHRIGQEDSVVVQYLVAKGTADDEIWPLVQKKLDILNKAGLSKDNFKNSETVTAESSAQPRIEEFWQELDSAIDLETLDGISTKRQKL